MMNEKWKKAYIVDVQVMYMISLNTEENRKWIVCMIGNVSQIQTYKRQLWVKSKASTIVERFRRPVKRISRIHAENRPAAWFRGTKRRLLKSKVLLKRETPETTILRLLNLSRPVGTPQIFRQSRPWRGFRLQSCISKRKTEFEKNRDIGRVGS